MAEQHAPAGQVTSRLNARVVGISLAAALGGYGLAWFIHGRRD